jgi:uncharacterized membrane-anchored protein
MTATRLLIAIGAALVLGAVNLAILDKESVKRNGRAVYVELGPRDPRSLMQGDYMALNFPLAQQIRSTWGASPPREGERRLAPIVLDERQVARLARQGEQPTLDMRYRVRNNQVWLGTNAFFFEEGSDQRYAVARFGEFRVDPSSGEAVLVGLRDAKLSPL